MKGDRIAYREGVLYQLATTYRVQTDIRPPFEIFSEYIDLDLDRWLTIRHGYCWDGASFKPLQKNRKMMRGSLVHDAFADLMRMGFLDHNKYFHAINRELEKICEEDGIPEPIADAVYFAVDQVSDGKWAKYGEDGGRTLCFAP